MKKLVILVVVAVLLAVAVPVLAKGPTGPAGKSNKAHLYLYEKTGEPDWDIVEKGAWGKMIYDQSGPEFNYVFNGHDLVAGEDYTLVYYPDPWPGSGLVCLGNSMANKGGNVHIKGPVDTGDLPKLYDWNHPNNPENSTTTRKGGAKIWLVKSSDVDCDDQMTAWDPAAYLFEEEVINFDDTDTNEVLERLENKNADWTVINDDSIYGELYYSDSGSTFQYAFYGYGLTGSTEYSLIYYADGWPGNHPGALIGKATTGSLGDIALYGNPELGIDLPDSADDNYLIGAKVWLIPSSHYNETTKSMTTFQRPFYLFETDYVVYDDTDV